MDYRKEIIERLRRLPDERASLVNLPEQIKALESRLTAIRASRTDGDPVSGGTNRREDMLINTIMEIDKRKADLEEARHEVNVMERNLAALKPNERRALELFYIIGERRAAERLANETGYSEPQAYRIKSTAVENLARRLYGRVLI